ncbi:MAG: sarcosine oxidase subunit delta [Kiloniellales bacterium]|jgi:sarcosine oxidase subunit delta|nr:sarcosine oxidase subunit delta [Kiloniellales bacterium]
MLLIPCPYCGERDETEFSYGAEAHIVRPADPEALSDAEWADYVFMRPNTKGVLLERWVHSHGCRRWFNVARDTVTYRIHAVYKIGETPPRVPKPDYV